MRRLVALLSALLLACAMGYPESEELPSEVFFPGAGDDECSIPGVLDGWLEDHVPQSCCLTHDAVYEYARLHGLPEEDRYVADTGLLACCAYETGNEFLCGAVYRGVRWGGWPSWYDDPDDERITDEWEE